MSRSRRQIYSSGEDSWEDEKWSQSYRGMRRHDKLEVPGSRSRSSSHSRSAGRLRAGSSGSHSYNRTSPIPSNSSYCIPKKQSPRKSPSPHSVARKRQKSRDRDPFGSPVRRRASGRSRTEVDEIRRRPRTHSPGYERRRRRSFTPEDYHRGQRSPIPTYEDRRKSSERAERFKYSKQYRHEETENTESMTESPEETRRKKSSKKESRSKDTDFASLIEKTMSRVKEKEPEQGMLPESSGPVQSENEYENYSPKANRELLLEDSQILQMGRNSPIENVTQQHEGKMSAASVAETIIVQPAEEREAPLYTSQFRLEPDTNYLSPVPDDDKDSGIGFTIGDLNADFSPSFSLKKESGIVDKEPEHFESPPKQWTLFSFSPSGPLKVRDEETGEIFTVINELPIENTEDIDNDDSQTEEAKEDDVGWCSVYLIIRVIGLLALIAGLAGMVIYSINK